VKMFSHQATIFTRKKPTNEIANTVYCWAVANGLLKNERFERSPQQSTEQYNEQTHKIPGVRIALVQRVDGSHRFSSRCE